MLKHIKNLITIKKNPIIFLLILYFLAVSIRLYVVKDYNFPFWFDNGRDAMVSREILEKADLKVQGPTASGTGDAVYHGVFYYYLIGPLYSIFAGDPQSVLNTLIIFSSLAIFAVYGLSFDLTHKKSTALLAAFFYVFSFDAIRANTWFSNPIIASVSIPFLFYLLHLIFFKKNKNKYLLPSLAFVLALTHQSAILFVTLWGVVAVAFFYAAQNKKFLKNFSLKNIFTSLIVYLLGISSMLLAQFKAFRAGIFNLSSIGASVNSVGNNFDIIWGTVKLIILKLSQVIFPSLPILSLILITILIIFIIKTFSKSKQIFLLLVVSSPLFLLSWRYYNMYHSFFGLEALAVIVLAIFIFNLSKFRYHRFLQIGIITLFLFSNISALKLESEQRATLYYLPQGAYLKDQLDLIDKSYQLAEGQDFSISSVTNPYGYNSLWSYLYSWYGQEKYDYTPKFYGPKQAGLFGEDLLEEADAPSETHFSIHEPTEGIPVWLRSEFQQDQTREIGELINESKFGTMKLELR
ncbi:MAG: hypothetical protein ABFQ62_01755 [Patescibacteria group bacterium]